jgi:hypothetical protein
MIDGINSPAIKSERAYAVYDKSGAIVHVHYVTTFEGAKDTSAKADRTQALALAEQFGHRVEGLKVVAADIEELRTARRVNIKTGRLICES